MPQRSPSWSTQNRFALLRGIQAALPMLATLARPVLSRHSRLLSTAAPSLFRQQCYVNGQWVDAASGRTTDVTNPATGEVIGTVPRMSGAETAGAIEAARVAQVEWAARTGKERHRVLLDWFNLVMANQEELAQILTREQGKPLAEARGEVGYGASFIEWFAEEAKRTYGDVIPGHQRDKRIHVSGGGPPRPAAGPGTCSSPSVAGAEAADRRGGGDYAVELPQRDDHAQGGRSMAWRSIRASGTHVSRYAVLCKAGAALAAGCSMVLKPASPPPRTPAPSLRTPLSPSQPAHGCRGRRACYAMLRYAMPRQASMTPFSALALAALGEQAALLSLPRFC